MYQTQKMMQNLRASITSSSPINATQEEVATDQAGYPPVRYSRLGYTTHKIQTEFFKRLRQNSSTMDRLNDWLPSFLTDYGSLSTPGDNESTPSRRAVQLQEVQAYQEPIKPQNEDFSLILDIDDAIERLGMGRFQFEILVAAGLCFASDAMEVLLLSFLAVILRVEWDLTERETDSIISVVFAGAFIGTLILGPLGDIIGRKPVFSVTAAIIAVFGLGTALVPDYKWLLFARFMVGFGVGGLTVPFDTLAEFVPTSNRGRSLLYIEFFWTAGTLLVPALAWWALSGERGGGSWRFFVVLCAIPCVFSTVLGLVYVPESPRWLLTQGKPDKALRILRAAAQRNGKDPFHAFPDGIRLVQNTVHDDSESESVWDLFSPKWFRTTMLLWGAWFGLQFLYYGVIIAVSLVFSVHDVDANGEGGYEFDYSAIFISASSEILGLVLVLMTVDKWGRIPTQTFTYLGGGFSCLIFGFMAYAEAPRGTLLFLAFVARMFMMGATCTTWVSTTEILSTGNRATGHSAANAIGRMGGFFAPYIITEGNSIRVIGVVMFIVSIFTAMIAWQLPETQGKAMGGAHNDEDVPEKKKEPVPQAPYQII
jgi:MFS family permease